MPGNTSLQHLKNIRNFMLYKKHVKHKIKTNKKGRGNLMEDVKKASGLSTAALVTGIFGFIPGITFGFSL
jgi:hypothetical protein